MSSENKSDHPPEGPDRHLFNDIQDYLNQRTGPDQVYQLDHLAEGYRFAAISEGKSPNTIAIDMASVRYLIEFLVSEGLPQDVRHIDPKVLRRFVIYLLEKPAFANHPFTPPQNRRLSVSSVNAYMRSLQSVFAFFFREGFIEQNPFIKIKIPKGPQKVIPTLPEQQQIALLSTIDISTPIGYRDYALVALLLDDGMRCSEATGITLDDVDLERRQIKVHGKGNKERYVPIGATLVKILWKYTNVYRPESALPRFTNLFLTRNGRPLTKDRVGIIVKRHGKQAGITNVRCSPHTLRHTFAVTFLRNGGDVFTLQRIMGHSTLDMLKTYVNLAQEDVSRVHQKCSPLDNLDIKRYQSRPRKKNTPRK